MPKQKLTPGVTVPTQFRLKPDTLADLDAIREHLAATSGVPHSRSDAVRFAAREVRKKVLKKMRDSE